MVIRKSPKEEGWELENRVERILISLQNGEQINSHIRFSRNSREDQMGWDFEVRVGVITERFGVTTDSSRAHKSLARGINNLYFPIWIKDGEIARTILDLFKPSVSATAS